MANVYKEKLKELGKKKELLVTEQKRVLSCDVVTCHDYFEIKKRINGLNKQMDYCRSKLIPDIIA